MTAHIEIREATRNDSSAIAQILRASFSEFRPLYTSAGFSATTPDADQILLRLQEGPVWIALTNGSPVGTVAAVVKAESVYIRGMSVLPGSRKSGAGRALLHVVESWAKSRGATRLFLTTTPFLLSAIRLYEASGFERCDDPPHDLFGTPLFVMQKQIS